MPHFYMLYVRCVRTSILCCPHAKRNEKQMLSVWNTAFYIVHLRVLISLSFGDLSCCLILLAACWACCFAFINISRANFGTRKKKLTKYLNRHVYRMQNVQRMRENTFLLYFHIALKRFLNLKWVYKTQSSWNFEWMNESRWKKMPNIQSESYVTILKSIKSTFPFHSNKQTSTNSTEQIDVRR